MVGGETGKCVPLKGDFLMPVCVAFTPEGEDPPKDALRCEQVEVDGKKGTSCIHLDPSQEGIELPVGVSTERAAARFAPELVGGAELTDEQREMLEDVRREIAPDESSKSSDEALADRLSKSSTVGTIVSAMFMFNPRCVFDLLRDGEPGVSRGERGARCGRKARRWNGRGRGCSGGRQGSGF